MSPDAAALSRTTPWSAGGLLGLRVALDHGVVHDIGESAVESAASGKPVDVDGRCGIVADHSVVRWRRSAVENCPPAAFVYPSSVFRPPFSVERFPMAAAFLGYG